MALTLGDHARADPEVLRAAQKRLAKIALDAREDPCSFFEFVMRHGPERKRSPIAPHQRVFLDFVMAHDRSVSILPVGHSKSIGAAALSMLLLGQDPTTRGAIVSAAEAQAMKPLGVVSDYIQTSQELKLVFPDLAPTRRSRELWTQTAITVDRPPGIADPSLVAIGFDSKKIVGSRLNWIVVDDILNEENTRTKEAREKLLMWFDSSVLSRIDWRNARIIVINTAWHPDDIVHHLEKLPPDGPGWATLRMDIEGNVKIQDDWGNQQKGAYWDHPHLRPASPDPNEECYRLRAHDPDPDNTVPLWPGEFPRERIDKLRLDYVAAPAKFNQLYMGVCRDDASAMCKIEWVDLCKAEARKIGHNAFVSEWRRNEPTFTGVDLAFSERDTADDTALFTFAILETGQRLILECVRGKFSSDKILELIASAGRRYNSIVTVENNGAQKFVVDEARRRNLDVVIRAHRTDQSRANPEMGVPAIFAEMSQGLWLIPNDKSGRCDKTMQSFVDACLYYSPTKHPDDLLMACYFGRMQAAKWGMLSGKGVSGGQGAGSIALDIMSR